jgi:tetratricopeptide (TPR) repeat protein|tara:strand:- start:343 stop:1647 length:1305 start_codon:yes stop_codon:yes gene_type:complete
MIKHINKNIPITITVKGIALIISLFLILISNNSNAQKLEAYHPLKEDRTIIERAASAKQMSYNVNKKLEGIADRFGDGDLDGAMKNLEVMLDWNLSSYEQAVIYQFMGFIYVQKNDIDSAIDVFKKCVDINYLSNSQHQSTVFNLASLYGSQEKWDLAINTLMEFFKHELEPVAESYIMMGIAYFQKGEPLEALPYIHIANIKSLKPKESWLQLEVAILFLNQRFEEAVSVVKKLSTYWPEKEKYWETLAGVYMEMQKDTDALSALSLGYKNNALKKKETLENLARLSLYLEIPYQAATIIEENINSGLLEKNELNLRLLLGAWTAAREFDEAISVIDILAQITNEGKLYIQKAILLNEKGDWNGIKVATSLALKDANLENPGDVYILRGMAHTELKEYQEAIESFAKAVEVGSDTNKKNAEAWLDYVADRAGI